MINGDRIENRNVCFTELKMSVFQRLPLTSRFSNCSSLQMVVVASISGTIAPSSVMNIGILVVWSP